MQSGINGHEIYKNVSMRHAVVFADRAPEAKNAQVIGETHNSNDLKKRKNCHRNGQKRREGQIQWEKMLLLWPFGEQKSAKSDRKCLKFFFRNVLPTEGGEHFFAKNGPQTDQKSTQSGSDRLKSDRGGPNPGPIRFFAAHFPLTRQKLLLFA